MADTLTRFMAKLHIEGETFVTGLVPFDPVDNRPGTLFFTVRLVDVPNTLDDALRLEEERLWQLKVEDANVRGQNLTNGFQYLVSPAQIEAIKYVVGRTITVPVARGTYSRIELATAEVKKDPQRKDIPNVLALCEIVGGSGAYLFVERGGKVAYHGGTSQLHALVAGNYPRNLPQTRPEDMTPEKWLEAQQETEHKIAPEEIQQRLFLGIILDKTLGYKPDMAFGALTSVTADHLSERFAEDAWEKKGIQEVPFNSGILDPTRALRELILEHADFKRHVPPGLGAAIIELARRDTISALDRLNAEGRQHSAPLIEYAVRL